MLIFQFWVKRLDRSRFSASELESSKTELTLEFVVNGEEIKHSLETRYLGFKSDAHVWKVSLLFRDFLRSTRQLKRIQKLKLQGSFQIHLSGRTVDDFASEELLVERNRSSHILSLTTSSSKIKVGQNIIFHTRSNYPLSDVHFIIEAAGRIVFHRDLNVGNSKIITFDAIATDDMIPDSKAIVWHLSREKAIVSASCQLKISQRDDNVSLSSLITYHVLTYMTLFLHNM